MTDTVVASSLRCDDNTTSKITNSLNKFFNAASGGLGGAFDMVAGLDTAVSEISDAMSGLTNSMSNLLQNKLSDFISTGLTAAKNFIFNKIPNPLAAISQFDAFNIAAFKPIGGLFKAFGCLGSTIKKALNGTIRNLLTNMIKKGFINPLECAVTDFIGALTGKITSMMDSIVGPLLNPINSLFGKLGNAFGSVKGFLSKGLNLIGKVQGLLNCKDGGGGKCHVQNTYTLKNGSKPKKSNAANKNIIAKAINNMSEKIDSASTGVDNLTKDVGTWGIFGGKKNVITKESELSRVNKEKSELDTFKTLFNQRIESKNKQIEAESEVNKNLINEIKNLDAQINKINYASGDTSFTASRGYIVKKEQKQKLLKTSITRVNALKKDLISLKSEFDKNNDKITKKESQIEELNKLDDKSIIKSDIKDVTKDITREEVDCNSGNVLKCGVPKVEFFGGGGEGAAGDIILGNFIEELDTAISETEYIRVDKNGKESYQKVSESGSVLKETASIIGVDIKYPGEGYTSEPLVRFADNCDQGYGAYGRATIDKDPNSPTFGQLTGVLIISEGENYPTGRESDAFVDKIIVEEGGSGYKLDDEAGDFEICGVDENGSITKVCTNDKAYRTLPSTRVESATGSGAVLTPVMTTRRRQTGVINVIDCITPRGNIVGYVNGKEYNGPFHVMPNGVKMTGLKHSDTDSTIYNTPQESLRSGGTPSSNIGSTQIRTRTISELITESEASQTPTETYTDPVDEAGDMTPPSSPPPSSPPSSGSSGG